jgi:hypothetical protein
MTLHHATRQHTDVATARDKLISFCCHRRLRLAVTALLLLIMLVAAIVYFSYGGDSDSDSDPSKDVTQLPPAGKTGVHVSVPVKLRFHLPSL